MIRRLVAAAVLVPLLAPQPVLAAPGVTAGVPAVHAPASGWREARSKREPTAGQLSARERQKRCGAEWKEAKAANRVPPGQKWPQYWSACNKRLKGGTA